MDLTHSTDNRQDNFLHDLNNLMLCVAHVRSLVDRYIAANQSQEISSPGNDLDLEKTVDTFASCPALNHICRTFNLSLFETTILVACTGQAIDPMFPDLFAIAHNKAELNYPTFQLATYCFPQPHWNGFTEVRPLRRWQLVQYAPNPELTRACLQIDEAILHYLMGEAYRDPILSGTIALHQDAANTSMPLQPSYQKIVNQAAAIFDAPQSRMPIVQLCGTLRESQREIAANIGRELQLPLYRIKSNSIPADRAALQSLVMRWQRWYLLDPGLLLIEVNESMAIGEGIRQNAIDAFLESLNVPILLVTDERLQLSHPVVITFDVAALYYGEQLQLWQAAWPDLDDRFTQHLEKLAAQFRLSAAMIQTASATVQSESQKSSSDLSLPEIEFRLWDFCRLQARPQLEGLAQRIEVRSTWADFVLPEQEKTILQQILTHIRRQAKVYQHWGFADKNKRGLGLSVLFAGTSGTGKTTAAEVLAHELNLDLYRIDLSSIMSKYIGETEKNLRRIFDAAETGGGILLFDEADALFGKRTEVKDSHDRHANIEVSYLLQRMEAYQGLAILTTNLKDNLDRAFLRRLRFIVNFPYPKAPQRSEIWQRAFPKQMPTQDLNFKRLGQLDLTGGNIKSIALNAAFLAADADEPVKMKHILEATRTEYLKSGRTLTSMETKGWNVS